MSLLASTDTGAGAAGAATGDSGANTGQSNSGQGNVQAGANTGANVQGNTQGTSADAGTSSPYYKGLYGEDGKIDKKAWDRLPDTLKPYKDTFAKYDTFDGVLHALGNANSLLGKKGLAPLPANATDEMKASRAQLLREINGAPEKPDGYGVKKPEGEDVHWNDEYVNSMVGIMHKHNASPEFVKELFGADQQFAKKLGETTKAQKEQAEATHLAEQRGLLEKEWSNKADFTKNIDLAARLAKTHGMDIDDPIFRNANTVKVFAKIAASMSEDKLVAATAETASTAGSNFARANDIVQNAENPQHKAYHNNEPATVDLVNRMFAAHAATQRR